MEEELKKCITWIKAKASRSTDALYLPFKNLDEDQIYSQIIKLSDSGNDEKIKRIFEEYKIESSTKSELFREGGKLSYIYKKGGINIKSENKGKFTETKEKTGKSTEELTHSKNLITKKRAIFAENANKWKHQEGGKLNWLKKIVSNDPSKAFGQKSSDYFFFPNYINKNGYKLSEVAITPNIYQQKSVSLNPKDKYSEVIRRIVNKDGKSDTTYFANNKRYIDEVFLDKVGDRNRRSIERFLKDMPKKNNYK